MKHMKLIAVVAAILAMLVSSTTLAVGPDSGPYDGGPHPQDWVGVDEETGGDWVGRYGSYAYILAGYQVNYEGGPYQVPWNPGHDVGDTCEGLGYEVYTGNLGESPYAPPLDPARSYWITATAAYVDVDDVLKLPDGTLPTDPNTGGVVVPTWDDHGEAYACWQHASPPDSRTFPDEPQPGLYLDLTIPAGSYYLSIYAVDLGYYNRTQTYTLFDSEGNQLGGPYTLEEFKEEGAYITFYVEFNEETTVTLRVTEEPTDQSGLWNPKNCGLAINAVIGGVFLDRLCDITGHTPGPGALVKLFRDGNEVATTYTGEDGSFVFMNNPPGSYDVQIGPNVQSVVLSAQPAANCACPEFTFKSPGTGTPGYWKNHPEAWPVDEITIGGKTYTKDAAIALMGTPDKGDKTYTMFQALVAAKLNVLIGNRSDCIAATIANADAWMTTYSSFVTGKPVKAGGKDSPWRTGEPLYLTLDAYNNGLLCAPHRD